MSRTSSLLLLLPAAALLLLSLAAALPNGAPNCFVPGPIHPGGNTRPQTSAPPYEISAVRKLDGTYGVTIRGKELDKKDGERETFTGFRIMAKSELGVWTPLPPPESSGRPMVFQRVVPGREHCGATHADNRPKQQVTVAFTRPKRRFFDDDDDDEEEEEEEHPVFTVVVVKNVATFWTDISVPVEETEVGGGFFVEEEKEPKSDDKKKTEEDKDRDAKKK